MNRFVIVAGLCSAVFASSTALAQDAAETSAPGVHEHDGFYLRFGLGLGYIAGKEKPEQGSGDADVTGFGIPVELAFGGTPAPGLVIGGGSYGMYVPSPKLKSNGNETDGGALTISGIGPFVDYYLDPNGGAHFGGALLLASIGVSEKDSAPKGSGIGFGGAIFGGYEMWIGDQWSVGVIGRVAYYNAKVTFDAPGDPKNTISGITPAVLLGFTYH